MENKAGHLKIFFGYAAGVGKTYAMLEAAHLKYVQGVDVVAGYIEPHDRKETKALAFGLEEIPVKKSVYKDHLFYEFDIDKALERKPELILVDELAHTNVPGSRHQKRYQDIEELLRAGIDVYTTVNVQHLESLHDIVESITRVKVNERIPDRIFDTADDVQLVDIEIDQLLERLREGKIYHKKQAERALTNFFIKDNLAALREIALRRCADRINLLSANHNKPFTKEHILVCIGSSPTNQKVIRTASRMAQAFHADFTALYVETSDSANISDKALIQLNSNLALARHLNATIVSTYGDDIAFQIGQYAKTSAVSKLVIGRSIRKRSLFQKSTLVDQLTNYNPDLEIYIIPDKASKNQKSRFELKKFAKFTFRETLISIIILVLATLIGILFFTMGSSVTSIILIFLLAVSLIGMFTYFPIYNFLASIISIILINFLFIEPLYSLSMYSKDYFLVFGVMLIVAFIINTATRNLKIESILASNHAHMMDVLLETSQQLQTASKYEDIREVTCFQLQKLLNRLVIFYSIKEGKMSDPLLYGNHITQDANAKFNNNNEKAVAQWVYTNNKNAGATTSTLPNANALYLAIRKGSQIFAIVGIELEEHDTLQPFEKTLLRAILNEIALAFDSIVKDNEKLEEQFKDQMEHED